MPKKTTKTIELENQLKRALADYDNLKKRVEKEREEIVKFANSTLILKVLVVTDGFELILEQLRQILKEEGTEEIKVNIGEKFNPEIMEAIEKQGDEDKVTAIMQRGYKLHDRVIRPVKVKVGEKK